ncbi:MAG: hypothetical protein ABIF82_11835, partial [Planctomycetota bacterium]
RKDGRLVKPAAETLPPQKPTKDADEGYAEADTDETPEDAGEGVSYSKAKVAHLKTVIKHSRKKMESARDNYHKFVRELVGKNYSEDGSDDKVPLPFLGLAFSIYSRNLAASAPRLLITSDKRELKPVADTWQLATNRLIEKIDLEQTLKEVVGTAMFFPFGVAKHGLDASNIQALDGIYASAGQPYCSAVDPDDFVIDMTARKRRDIEFIGHRYRRPLSMIKRVAKSSQGWNAKAVADLKASAPKSAEGEERASEVAAGRTESKDELTKHVELWDVWLPDEGPTRKDGKKSGLIVTIADADGAAEALRVVEYDGPDGGPYVLLGFMDVPGNLLPLCPAALWYDLHDLANKLYRKLGRQALRQKTFLTYPGGTADDAERVKGVKDGEAIQVDHQNSVLEQKTGGPEQNNLLFTLKIQDEFSRFANNLDILGGLGAMSPTAKQDEMLSGTASKVMQEMQDRTYKAALRMGQALAWYLFTDPMIEEHMIKRIPGFDISVPVSFTPEERMGDVMDYNFRVEPYSMQKESPQTHVAALMELLGLAIPNLPLLQQDGFTLNWKYIMSEFAKFRNLPELANILVAAGPADEAEQQTIGTLPAKWANTTRRYIRENRSAPTAGAKDAAFAALLQGQPQQPAQNANLGRPAQ